MTTMREIKFRGYNGEKWLFGNLDIDYKAKHACISDNRFWRHPVRFDTVGQFTGIKDISGEEIYEGDIVTFKDDETDEYVRGVIAMSKNGTWRIECKDFFKLLYDERLTTLILSNVHDNPELLECKP